MLKKMIVLGCASLMLALVSTGVANPIDPDLMGWWPLTEGSGNTATDHAGTGNHGSIQNMGSGGLGLGGSVWFNDPSRGIVLSFNGDDLRGAFVTFNQRLPRMTMVNGFTWAFWAKQQGSGSGGNDIIFGNRFGGLGDRQWIKFTPSKAEYVNESHVGTIDYVNVPGDVWVHMAIVKDRNRLIHYRNGEVLGTSTITGTIDEIPFYLAGAERGERWAGLLSDVYLYTRALSQKEILLLMEGLTPEYATAPTPEDKDEDILRDVTLTWKPGIFAATHDLYLGTTSEEVSDAGADSPLLIGPSLDVNRLDVHGLKFGQTYFWRVDEVNTLTDPVVFKGKIWRFTVEPLARPVDAATTSATASSQYVDSGPEKTIDGSGLNAFGQHSTSLSDMWLSNTSEPNEAWIQYEFDTPCKLYEMLAWNFNGQFIFTGFGLKNVTIATSTDGVDWIQNNNVFAKASGRDDYIQNSTVEFGGVTAKMIKITAQNNWSTGLALKQYGLSEVQFLQIPVSARKPSPDAGVTGVTVDATLNWIAGREASEHNVYFSTDEQAVIAGTAPMETVPEATYSPSLELGTTYYWRVDEVNDATIPSVWPGATWSFTTTEMILVDDFNDYDSDDNGIWLGWKDGYGVDQASPGNGTGSYIDVNAVAHVGAGQCMQLYYDNSGTTQNVLGQTNTATYSAVSKILNADEKDWSQFGIQTLSLVFMGQSGNTGTFYVKVNNAKTTRTDISGSDWQTWDIPLASLGINLQNITNLEFGVEGSNASGTILIDDIMLK